MEEPKTEEGFLVVFLGSGHLLPSAAILAVFPCCQERRTCDWEVCTCPKAADGSQ